MMEIPNSLQAVGVANEPSILRFGIFELHVATGELRKEGRLVHLRHQSVGVLTLLLLRAGELVTRHEITSAIWPDDIDIDVEQGLNHCMKEIRVALNDRPESPRFIQTLPRRGYRFLVDVLVEYDTLPRVRTIRPTFSVVPETTPSIEDESPEPEESEVRSSRGPRFE
jgi:DNA-binding winged helix-turn-helix (wHTH) protein